MEILEQEHTQKMDEENLAFSHFSLKSYDKILGHFHILVVSCALAGLKNSGTNSCSCVRQTCEPNNIFTF